MLPDYVILQSAGSLSVAVLALIMLLLQALFFSRNSQFTWYAWSAAISFSALIYSVGIFIEYNTPEGSLNRFSGLLEFTAIICWIHVVYGFTFSYLGIYTKWYHPVAGTCHVLILTLLWFTPYIVSESFTTRRFMALASPYVEAALGPLGPLFVCYAVAAGVNAMIIWIRHKTGVTKHRIAYLAGGSVWVVLGIHDGLTALGLSTLQYLMEYGFFAFALAAVWVGFNSYLETAAEEKYRVITEFANDCITVIQDGKIVFRNRACCELTGLPLTNSTARELLDITAPEDRKMVFGYYRALLKDGHSPHPITASIRRSEGEQRFIEISSSLIQHRGRTAALSIMRDITERKRAEEILRESEEKYRSMMEAMGDSVYICSPDFRVVYMNPSLIKITGRDATGERCHKALFNEDKQCQWCLHDRVQQGEICETEMVSPKDNRFYHITYSPIFHEDGSVSTMIIYRDITLTKRLQEQLLRSDRLSATGQLAATIAHEINSPLQGITSLLHSIERTHNNDLRLLEKLGLVKKGFMSIRDTVKKLLDLNRPGKEAKQSANINRIIEDTAGLLKSYLERNRVKITLTLSSALPNVTCSPQQLGQVFMNLISNAVEAMAGNIMSKDGLSTREPIENRVAITSDLRGDDILIEVADAGSGISEQDMEHLFEPFYTRKKELGMGIGLSLCHSIIEDHKGTISAKNSPGGGAVFTITLPTR
ncbi:MAG: Histidine kinase [Thermodesulfobacteriota bacterium]|nr:Histidine kinase [Thermodesulfobacteriota bacterium]